MEKILLKEGVRALTWKEPFAQLMLFGKIETRTWPTTYRGYVLICAAKRDYPMQSILNICGSQFSRMMNVLTENKINYNPTKGYAIALGKLIDCRFMTKADEDKCFVEFHPDLYCHIYEDVRPIKPMLWKGVQGWSILKNETIEKIKFI